MKSTCLPVFNYSLINQANDTVDIYIDGDIVDASTQEMYREFFGDETSTSYKSFRDQVNKLNANTYNVYVNSGGGLVTDAMAIHDFLIALQDDGKVVNTEGRGIIASAATYVLMAGKKPKMSSNSWLMIHNVSGFVRGDVNQVEQYAAMMRKFNDKSNEFYQKATGLSKTVLSNMMDAETWMTAQDAKDKGFIKEIAGEATFKNSIKPENWQFQNKAVLNFYNSFTNSNIVDMDTNKITETINNGFNKLLENLGLVNKKDDAGLQAALREFSDGITNAVKDAVPTSESIATMVTNEVKTAVADLIKAESFTNVIKNNVTEATKNLVTEESLTNSINGVKDLVVKQMGKQTTDAPASEAKNKGPKNRFDDVEWNSKS